MELKFHPDLFQELSASYEWYESKAKGLGDDFITELDTAFVSIKEMPDTWPFIKKGFRRFLLNKFPFGIIYKEKTDCIFIIAVMHLSRKPGYWIERKD